MPSTIARITPVAAAIAASLMLAACTSGNDTSSPTLVGKTSKIHLSVVDAGAGLVGDDIELTFGGLTVLGANDQPVTSLTVAADKADDIVLKVKSQPEQPRDLVIQAHASGYLDAGTSVVVSSQAVDQAVVLKMLKDQPGKLGDGIIAAYRDLAGSIDASDKATSEISLTSEGAAGDPALKVTIPAGTVLTDKDGNPVTGGTLKIVAFDPRKPRAYSAYPGGMNVLANVDGFTGIDGSPASGKQQINFKTAGFAIIQIEGADGRKVKHFSQDIEIAMQFPEGTKDADGNAINVGDPVPIWSYDEATGEWSFEKNGAAADLDATDGLLDVVYNTDHLTAWNLDWHYSAVCTANINVIDSLGVNQLSQVDHFIVSIPSAPIYRNLPNNNPSTGDLLLFNVPVGYPATVTAYDANGVMLGSVSSPDLCDGHAGPGGWNTNIDNEVDLVLQDPPAPVNVTFTASCPNGSDNVPGYNSNSISLPSVLTPTGLGANITLPNGVGQVGTGSYDITGTNGSQGLFNFIDWGNNGNPANNTLTINGASYTQNFVLSNAYCSPTTATISGSELPASDIGSYYPRDVAKDAHGNLYVSTAYKGILKYDGQTLTTLIPKGSGSAQQPYPTAAPVVINANTPNVFTSDLVQGLDLGTINNKEYLIYADTHAHCVNFIDLQLNAVVTVAGQCGQSGGNTPGVDVSNLTSSVPATGGGKLTSPLDVAYFAGEKRLFISQLGKVKMVKTFEQNPSIWDVAGTGAMPNSAYTDGADAATTAISPYMFDVAPNGDIVMSDRGHMLTRVSNINYAPTGDPAAGAQLYRVSGVYGSAGDFTATLPALDPGVLYNITRDVEIDTSGNIYFADHYNNRVRRILVATGQVEVMAGFGGVTLSTLNQTGPVNVQSIWRPLGLWVEGNGDFYLTQAAGAPYNVVRHVTY